MKPVVVDANIWVHHWRETNPLLMDMMADGEIWTHPIVIGDATSVPENPSRLIPCLKNAVFSAANDRNPCDTRGARPRTIDTS